MQYMLMFYVTPDDLAKYTDDRAEAYMAGWTSYVGAIYESGAALSGEGLLPPSTATTVRLRGDKRQVQDGPFADTKEQLGGYFIIEVPHLDAALEWAARAPCAATGGVEVRPVMPRKAA
ncbi:MAG: hypothetical protein JWP52_1192 [Rhizobacter sp.]|nr:hypothetical protein [Rhizobacter sp.]